MRRDYEGYIKFWPEFKEDIKEIEKVIYFIYRDKKILVKNDRGSLKMPTKTVGEKVIQNVTDSYYLGELEGVPCICGKLKDDIEIASNYQWITLNDSYWEEEEQLYFIAIKAMQLMAWDINTRYCGRCGNYFERKVDERAKICPKCGKIEYPRISPAVIVGVTKGKDVLLAHNAHFKEGLYSIIAGFVEQGETLEEAVKREVYEEVGIRVKNIKYISSRPWVSADSLMLGFTAEYESGEITPDLEEILDAGWYNKDHLPPVLPLPITTARQIINELMGITDKI